MNKRDRLKAREADEGKNIKVADSASVPALDYPVFCFKHLSKSHGLDRCTDAEKAAFVGRLAKLSGMTWTQIQFAPKHGLGSEKIAVTSIKTGLPSFLSNDVSFLLSYRFDGLKPFVAHKSGTILHILYIDNKFDVYPHPGS